MLTLCAGRHTSLHSHQGLYPPIPGVLEMNTIVPWFKHKEGKNAKIQGLVDTPVAMFWNVLLLIEQHHENWPILLFGSYWKGRVVMSLLSSSVRKSFS